MSPKQKDDPLHVKRFPRKKFLKGLAIAGIATTGVVSFLKNFTRLFEHFNAPPQLADLVNFAFRSS
jgi:hypothetical protein